MAGSLAKQQTLGQLDGEQDSVEGRARWHVAQPRLAEADFSSFEYSQGMSSWLNGEAFQACPESCQGGSGADGYTVAELSYLTEMDEDQLLKAVQELMRTNMFLMTSSHLGNTYESRYELSQLARAYLTKFYPAAKELQLKLLALKNKLISGSEEQLNAAKRNPLSPYTIHMRGRSDWVIAKHLRDALALAKDRDFEESLKLVEKAQVLSPDFYEGYRVEGWINALIGNASQAYDSYERAIETEPKAANARMMFAGFLLRDLHDAERAAKELQVAMDLLPDNPEPKLEFARCCLFLGRFDEAEAILAMVAMGDTVPTPALPMPAERPLDLEGDLDRISDADIGPTARKALVEARLGQGRYRRELLRRWGGACAVTGCQLSAVLRASHCKPWRLSSDGERLDSHNGLILSANLDALFDVGLISFDDDGAMLVSPSVSLAEREQLQVPADLSRPPGKKLQGYLRFHREHVFLRARGR